MEFLFRAQDKEEIMADVNHRISKEMAAMPYAVYALEDLNSIRVQKRRGKRFNRKFNGWAFHQLEEFLRYKAEALGKQVVLVDSQYSSQKCSRCGYMNHADLNAAYNIAQAGKSCLGRPRVNRPIVAGPVTEHSVSPQLQAPSSQGGVVDASINV